MRQQELNRWTTLAATGVLSSLALLGCRSTAAPVDAPIPIAGVLQEPEYEFLPAARVLRVNRPDSYVILECTVLPSAGEPAKVYRGDAPVAELLITGRRRGPYVIAEKVSGDCQSGDMVKFRCVVTRDEEEVAP